MLPAVNTAGRRTSSLIYIFEISYFVLIKHLYNPETKSNVSYWNVKYYSYYPLVMSFCHKIIKIMALNVGKIGQFNKKRMWVRIENRCE